MGMSPLRELVDSTSRILIAFDDNCQPFPPMQKPDIRQIIIEKLLEMLFSYGVEERNIELLCAVALHRKMKRHELAYMLGVVVESNSYSKCCAHDGPRIAETIFSSEFRVSSSKPDPRRSSRSARYS